MAQKAALQSELDQISGKLHQISTGSWFSSVSDTLLFALWERFTWTEDSIVEITRVAAWVFLHETDSMCVFNKYNMSVSYFGFSSGSGSLRPRPTGLFSDSSAVTRWSSASTLPCNDIIRYWIKGSLLRVGVASKWFWTCFKVQLHNVASWS